VVNSFGKGYRFFLKAMFTQDADRRYLPMTFLDWGMVPGDALNDDDNSVGIRSYLHLRQRWGRRL